MGTKVPHIRIKLMTFEFQVESDTTLSHFFFKFPAAL